MCARVYMMFVTCLSFFLKDRPKKKRKVSLFFFFSSFSKLIKKSVSFLRKRKRKINHTL